MGTDTRHMKEFGIFLIVLIIFIAWRCGRNIAVDKCGICGRELKSSWADLRAGNTPEDVAAVDCGGDCLHCMATCGDPQAKEILDQHGIVYDDSWLNEDERIKPE